MKILLLICLLSFSVFGSPLIFKSSKVLTSNVEVELGSFDASKYKQIRIAVKIINSKERTSRESAQTEYSRAKADFERKSKLLETGDVTKSDVDAAKTRLDYAQIIFNNSSKPAISIFAVEPDDEIYLNSSNDNLNLVIDSPPSKLRFKVFGEGTYKHH